MPPLVRIAAEEDVARITEIIVGAFSLDNLPEKRRKQTELIRDGFRDFLVLEDDGRVVSALRLGRDRLQIGRAVILKGELGHVGTDPTLQGRGYATALMNGAIAFMLDNGFHCTRLGGLMHFYSRFGYEPFIRRYVDFPVRPEGIKGLSWDDMYGMAPELQARVRRLDPARDHEQVHALRRAFCAGRSGCVVLPEDPGPPPASAPRRQASSMCMRLTAACRASCAGMSARLARETRRHTISMNWSSPTTIRRPSRRW